MKLVYALIIGGSVSFGAASASLLAWLGVSASPFALLLVLTASPFVVAMGFAAKRELEGDAE